MFAKQLDKFNSLLDKVKDQAQNNQDSIALISTNMGRTTGHTSFISRPNSAYTHKPYINKSELFGQLQLLLQELFRAKCRDMRIDFNMKSCQLFCKTFTFKNKIKDGKVITDHLNLNNFNLGPSCLQYLNTLI